MMCMFGFFGTPQGFEFNTVLGFEYGAEVVYLSTCLIRQVLHIKLLILHCDVCRVAHRAVQNVDISVHSLGCNPH